MRRRLAPLALLVLATAAAACAPATPAGVAPTPSAAASAASVAPSASVSAVPASASPTASPSEATSAAPSPTASAPASPNASTSPIAGGLDLTRGKLLRQYDFNNIAGLYYNLGANQLFVIDAVDDDVTDRRYLVRRFSGDGTFEAAIDLHQNGEDAPEAVEGFAFDLAGVPAFTYLEDEEFKLKRLYTATVQDASRLPTTRLERAGLSALGADGDVFTLGVIRLDPDAVKGDTRVREIFYVRAEEDEAPEALFRIPDPFEPTTRMAVGPGGVLYLVGPKGSALGIKRVTKDQQVADLPIPLTKIPDHVWVAPTGHLIFVNESTGNEPARLLRYTPEGAPAGETALTLANGAKIFAVDGLTFDGAGKVIIAGQAIAADLSTTSGLFTFD